MQLMNSDIYQESDWLKYAMVRLYLDIKQSLTVLFFSTLFVVTKLGHLWSNSL